MTRGQYSAEYSALSTKQHSASSGWNHIVNHIRRWFQLPGGVVENHISMWFKIWLKFVISNHIFHLIFETPSSCICWNQNVFSTYGFGIPSSSVCNKSPLRSTTQKRYFTLSKSMPAAFTPQSCTASPAGSIFFKSPPFCYSAVDSQQSLMWW